MNSRRRPITRILIPVILAAAVVVILLLVRSSVGEAKFDNIGKTIEFKNITTQSGGLMDLWEGEIEVKAELTGGSRLHLMVCTSNDPLFDETIEQSGTFVMTLPKEDSYVVLLEGDSVSGTLAFAKK